MTDESVVIVGACGHGLAISRALARSGVPVVVLESDMRQPGAYSRYGEVRRVDSIHGQGLLAALLDLSKSSEGDHRPVLMLTNDRMVRDVAGYWPALEGKFRLSWSHCRERLLPLLDKDSIEPRCVKQRISYPASILIHGLEDVTDVESKIGWPIIVKPVQPLSGFKVHLPPSVDALRRFVENNRNDLPFIAQAWIPGDDTSISFGALLLDKGRVIGHLEGRKIRSRPMGHTTIAEVVADPEVYACARQFFDGLELSGPVSLEVKRDSNGRLWVIEPTVGRTDFWVGLCIQNGFNIPLLEYLQQQELLGRLTKFGSKTVWINEERDPSGFLWLLASRPAMMKRKFSFLYACTDDCVPFLVYLKQAAISSLRRLMSRIRKSLAIEYFG